MSIGTAAKYPSCSAPLLEGNTPLPLHVEPKLMNGAGLKEQKLAVRRHALSLERDSFLGNLPRQLCRCELAA